MISGCFKVVGTFIRNCGDAGGRGAVGASVLWQTYFLEVVVGPRSLRKVESGRLISGICCWQFAALN